MKKVIACLFLISVVLPVAALEVPENSQITSIVSSEGQLSGAIVVLENDRVNQQYLPVDVFATLKFERFFDESGALKTQIETGGVGTVNHTVLNPGTLALNVCFDEPIPTNTQLVSVDPFGFSSAILPLDLTNRFCLLAPVTSFSNANGPVTSADIAIILE